MREEEEAGGRAGEEEVRHSLKEDESGLARCREEGRKEGRERKQ